MAVRSLRAEDPQRWLDVEFHVVVVQRDTPADVIKMLSIMQNAASASNITAKLSDVIARCAEVVFLFFLLFFSECFSRSGLRLPTPKSSSRR